MFVMRIRGSARYFDDSPVAKPILSTLGGAEVVGRNDGSFEIVVPEADRAVGVFPHDYSEKRPECWLWGLPAFGDVEVNVRLGGLGVYEMQAWSSRNGRPAADVFIRFAPMSIARLNAAQEENGDIEPDSREMWPQLDADRITVLIGDERVPVKAFTELPAQLSESNSGPEYLVVVSSRDYERNIISIMIEDRLTIDGRTTVDYGEGHFFGFLDRSSG